MMTWQAFTEALPKWSLNQLLDEYEVAVRINHTRRIDAIRTEIRERMNTLAGRVADLSDELTYWGNR